MKICLLGNIASIHLQRWATQLAKLKHQVDVISFETAPALQNIRIHQIKSKIPTKLKYISSIPIFKKIIKKIKPDLVHAHYIKSYGFIGACLNFKPFVVSAWGSDILIAPQKNIIMNLFVRFAIKKADLVHAPAEFVRKTLITLGAKPNQIIIIPFGVDEALLKQSGRKKTNRLLQSPVIISTRLLEPIYNVSLLIKSLPYILNKNKTIKCLIVGKGSQMKKLYKLTQNLKVENNVKFLGALHHDKLLEYLKEADIFVSTSLSDINNVSLNEAMAYGLFPICTDIPANRRWINNKINGFLVPINSPVILAQKIIKACQNKHLMKTAQKINWDIIKKQTILDNNILKIEKKYQELISLYK